MAHRLFHSLVFSSVMALEGCALSHSDSGSPPDPLFLPPDAQVDGSVDDAAQDATTQDRSVDALVDAVPDARDPRLCEPGWPTTKATVCAPIEPEAQFECCSSRDECCITEAP
ncbi:MAG: hypothetical protein AAGF12_06450 [Myxococcota bacterium]